MRVLVVSAAFPHEPEKLVHGVYQRLDLLMGALGGVGTIDCLFFVERDVETSSEATERYRRRLAEHWGVNLRLRLVPREAPSPGMGRIEAYASGTIDGFRQPRYRLAAGARQQEALEAALADDPDLLFVHRLPAMAPALRTRRPLPPVVFDLDDIEHVAFARELRQPPMWPGKRLHYLRLPALWLAERRAVALARRTFVCSEKDRRYLARTMRVSGATVIPNAVSVMPWTPPPAARTALFVGSLSYGPNRNAANHLAREIWPRVRREVPDATLTIAGRHPERVPAYRAPPAGVEFAGFVDDLDGLYEGTRVVCAPIEAGGGTRIKLIEAAAYGKPIVSTRLGAEGLEMRDGEHFLERDDTGAFAAAVVELLRDDVRCAALGRAARTLVAERYARERVQQRIRETVLSVVGGPPPAEVVTAEAP